MSRVLGTCTLVPDGRVGPWAIETFEMTPAESKWTAVRTAMGDHNAYCQPGTYKRLIHDTRGVVMSNTPMEVRTNMEAFIAARGRVLMNGLGMGMLLEAILTKLGIDYVRVIEIEKDVIDLVGRYFTDPRVEIINASATDYRPAAGERFNYVWHDIWDDISADNLDEMSKLCRIYGRRADKQGVWSREWIRADERRYG